MFFNFTRKVEVIPGDSSSIVSVINGVSWDSIERFYTDEKGILNIILKSQTEGHREALFPEGKKMVPKVIKTTVNVIITVEEADDVERFLKHMGIEVAKVKPELTGMD